MPAKPVPDMLMTRQRLRLMVVVFVLLSSLYMLFFTADFREFGDSPYILNITSSLIRYGDTQFDLMAFNTPDRIDNRFYAERLYPLYSYPEDLLSPVLAIPLYWAALHLPGLGLVHTTWLLNVLLCALTCVLLMIYAWALGYRDRTAAAAGLALGLATLCLPYARSFLQEPSVMVVTLALALLLDRFRASEYRARGLLPVILVLVYALFNGKLSAPVALPTLLIVLFPARSLASATLERRWQRGQVAALALIALGIVVIAFVPMRGLWEALDRIIPVAAVEITFLPIAIRTYFFGVGAGLWATSPLLLLALPGVWWLLRAGRSRQAWIAITMTLSYTFGYALFRGEPWYGSVTWPVRFLLPAIPFLMLAVLPVIDQVVHAVPPRRGLRIVFAALVGYGLWINFNGVAYRWDTYDKLLPQGLIMTRGDAAFNPAWMPWVLLPRLWGDRPFDFAWVRTGEPLFPVLFVLLAAACAGALWWLLRTDAHLHQRYMTRWVLALPVGFVVCVYVGLRLIYLDPLYLGQSRELWQMREVLAQETEPPDVVFITSTDHIAFMFNYAKSRQARLVGLTFQPGERYSPDQPPLVSGTLDPRALVSSTTIPLIQAAAAQRTRFWLLTDFGPFHPWAVRVVERYIVTEYYFLRSIETAPHVRLIEYATPGPAAEGDPQQVIPTESRFGESLRLTTIRLPAGTRYAVGDALPVGLEWRADSPPAQDYTTALFLATPEGRVVAQGVDSFPVVGFSPTSTWTADDFTLWDNRALRIPADLPPGSYRVLLRLYHAESTGVLDLLPVTGGDGTQVMEGTILVLPVEISVVERGESLGGF